MYRILIVADLNDPNINLGTQFGLTKGYYLARAFARLGHQVDYLIHSPGSVRDNVCYLNISDLKTLNDYHILIFSMEMMMPTIWDKSPVIWEYISQNKSKRIGPKIIVRSDNPLWYKKKIFARLKKPKSWVISHIDYISSQTEEFKNLAINAGIPPNMLIVSNMAVWDQWDQWDQVMQNPYDLKHQYCVESVAQLTYGKALLPRIYLEHPELRKNFDVTKYIIVYIGRVKSDNGRIFNNMSNIMKILGDQYELHIFPASFYLPGTTKRMSARNVHHLGLLRDQVFADSTNIIIHHPYHHDKGYSYLFYAHCGIDFSHMRPNKGHQMAGHAKILDYSSAGLPIVCEENIGNLFVVKNAGNAIILPYMASDQMYALAIRKIVEEQPIDREKARQITLNNENWIKRAQELISQISVPKK
jgi:hypothetical protein